MLPEGWKHATIENLGAKGKPAVKAGPFGSSLKKEYYKPFGYKIYGQEQVISNDENYGSYFIDENKYNELKSCSVSPGDILISLVGTIGQTLLLSNSCQQGIINPRLLRVSLDKDRIIPAYIQYILASNYTQNILKRWAQGGTMGVLNAEMIKTFPILLPPLPEQRKIAAILSTWDRAIEGTEKLLANSQQQKKALMQQLLTGKKRLPGFTGEWIWKRSKEIFKSISIKNNPMDCELLSVTQDQGVVLRSLLERRVVMPDGSVQGYKLVNPGNFIISLRSFQGGLEYSYYRGLVSPAYTVLDNKIEIENEFYKFYFKSYNFIGHLAVATIGIRDGKQISYQDFSFIKLPYPPLPEQQAIAAVLTTADEEITAIESDLLRLRQEKKALMQLLLTGKRRVTVD
ncbi:restriction endonuclease subunit S [Acetobacter senegalensis]|uniref:restriction endonuclease subunit S n=1 Tax=Acetobacter senegalensis TaxID=446692 RepID=UPI00264D76B9|nr:restriction endonuclease subunit S [Acetobacter senegalensis]MDN7353435.1 restriction endonuclease subunit S [Acetobacter senegalensis]